MLEVMLSQRARGVYEVKGYVTPSAYQAADLDIAEKVRAIPIFFTPPQAAISPQPIHMAVFLSISVFLDAVHALREAPDWN